MAMNRIAYLGSDGNIFTIDPNEGGSRRLAITDPRVGPGGHVLARGSDTQLFYAWPTWSPDNTRLVASRVTIDGARPSYSLEVVDVSTGGLAKVYENEPNTVAVAHGDPHCACWSPDSKRLAFIASTQRGLVLFLASSEVRSKLISLVEGMPLYFKWVADCSALLVHRGQDLTLTSVDGPSPQVLNEWKNVGFGFRVPAMSRDSSKVVYASSTGSGNAIYLAETQGEVSRSRLIMEAGAHTAFMWSPTRDEVAIADSLHKPGPQFELLTIVGSDGSSPVPPLPGPMLAFFWSPNGEKIAYVRYEQERNRFTWNYFDRSQGESVELVEYWPSEEYVTLLAFFDQYACSNSIWSPDSTRIVFSGTLGARSGARNGASPIEDKVYVLDVRKGATPRAIATSHFATWSWG